MEKFQLPVVSPLTAYHVIEAGFTPPCKRTVLIGSDRYYLPFPYITYLLVGFLPYQNENQYDGHLCVYFSNEHPDLIETKFCATPFPNCSPRGFVCLGKDYCQGDLKKAVNSFWDTPFQSYLEWSRFDLYQGIIVRKIFLPQTHSDANLPTSKALEEWAKTKDILSVQWDVDLNCFSWRKEHGKT